MPETSPTQHYTDPEGIVLSSGETLAPLELAYQFVGHKTPDNSNVVLVCHALTGSADVLGWWEQMVGPGKAIDTDEYRVLCTNVIGSCYGSSGPRSKGADGKPFGENFPRITVADWVEAQLGLLEHLGIKRLHSVIGPSLGGMQALYWGCKHSGLVGSVIAIACAPWVDAYGLAFDAVAREAARNAGGDKTSDNSSRAEEAMYIARMLGNITYRSRREFNERFGRKRVTGSSANTQVHITDTFEISNYLRTGSQKFINRFDPVSYQRLTEALDSFSLAEEGADLAASFADFPERFLVISFDTDTRFPPFASEQMVAAALRARVGVTYACLSYGKGHDSFLFAQPDYQSLIAGFLAHR